MFKFVCTCVHFKYINYFKVEIITANLRQLLKDIAENHLTMSMSKIAAVVVVLIFFFKKKNSKSCNAIKIKIVAWAVMHYFFKERWGKRNIDSSETKRELIGGPNFN